MLRRMNHRIRRAFSAFSIILAIGPALPSLSNAETVCLKSSIRNGRVRHRTYLVAEGAKCPSGSTSILNSQQATTVVGTGLVGPQGPQGIQGPIGPQGPAGANFQYVSLLGPVDSVSPKFLFVPCPAGTIAVGGSFGLIKGQFTYYDGPVSVTYAFPNLTGDTFIIRAQETTATDTNWGIVGLAICKP